MFDIVQKTKSAVYPLYYTKAVVDFFSRLHSPDNIKSDIAKGDVYILDVDGVAVGTGSYTENYITSVYVLPEYQGRGYGNYIMDRIEADIFMCYDCCVLDSSLSACIFYENR